MTRTTTIEKIKGRGALLAWVENLKLTSGLSRLESLLLQVLVLELDASPRFPSFLSSSSSSGTFMDAASSAYWRSARGDTVAYVSEAPPTPLAPPSRPPGALDTPLAPPPLRPEPSLDLENMQIKMYISSENKFAAYVSEA